MKLALFSKHFPKDGLDDFIRRGKQLKLDGFDLAVRPGMAVTPANAATELPRWKKALEAEGLSVPMVTGPWDLLDAQSADAKTILSAMDKAEVRFLKIGYLRFDPKKHASFEKALEEGRACLKAWEQAGKSHGVRILYHTHSNTGGAFYLGSNAGSLRLLLDSVDARHVGAYLDAGHLEAEGEPFDYACELVRPWLSAVALKDVIKAKNADGTHTKIWTQAGKGMVSWPVVASTLMNLKFQGPISVHAEYQVKDEAEFQAALPREAAFFRELLP